MKPVLRRPHNKRAPCIERILESESPSPAWPALNRGRRKRKFGGAKNRKPPSTPEFPLSLPLIRLTPATQARKPLFHSSIFLVKRTGIITGFTVKCYLNFKQQNSKNLECPCRSDGSVKWLLECFSIDRKTKQL